MCQGQQVWGPHPPSEGQRGTWGWVGGRGGSRAQAVGTCIPDLTLPFARCWRATDKITWWATSWARLTSTWLNCSTMWKSWTPAFWPTSLCWRWALPWPWGASHTAHLGIFSLDPGTGMLGSTLCHFLPSAPVPSLTCWSLSACLSPPLRADWLWLASQITIHTFCLYFQPHFPIFSFSCLAIWHISFPHTALEGEPAGLISRKYRKLNGVSHEDISGGNAIGLSSSCLTGGLCPVSCSCWWRGLGGPCLGGSWGPWLVSVMGLVFSCTLSCAFVHCRAWKPESAISRPWRSFCSLAARGSLPWMRKTWKKQRGFSGLNKAGRAAHDMQDHSSEVLQQWSALPKCRFWLLWN